MGGGVVSDQTRSVLSELHNLGIAVSVEGDRLHVKGKKSVTWTEQLEALISEHKPGIIALLRNRPAECPLMQAGLACILRAQGRCTTEPEKCAVAVGMRRYLARNPL
jgi:hypothetical protein